MRSVVYPLAVFRWPLLTHHLKETLHMLWPGAAVGSSFTLQASGIAVSSHQALSDFLLPLICVL